MTECKMLDNIKNGDLLVLDLEIAVVIATWDNHEVCGRYVYDKLGDKDFEVKHIVSVIKMNKSGIEIDKLIDKLNEIKKENGYENKSRNGIKSNQ